MIKKIEELISVLQAINVSIFMAINGYDLEFPKEIIDRLVNKEMEI